MTSLHLHEIYLYTGSVKEFNNVVKTENNEKKIHLFALAESKGGVSRSAKLSPNYYDWKRDPPFL